jgi:glycosyltransferase involved in cell wall biosynthesis
MDVTVIALSRPGEPPEEELDGVRVLRTPVARQRGGGLWDYLASYGRFFGYATWYLARRPRHFDLVHAHSNPEAMVFSAAVQRVVGRPVLLDVHDLSTELYANRRGEVPWPVRWIERLSLRFADAVVTVHDRYGDMLVERGLTEQKLTVILNLPDERVFGSERPPTWADGDLRISFHGVMLERSGVGAALDAMCVLRERIPGAQLSLIGEGDFRPEIERRIVDDDLEDVVQLSEGRVDISEIPELVKGTHIGLAPFLDNAFTAEILPTKLLEYVLMGIPVVVSRNRVIEQYFTDDMVTYVSPGDVEGLITAIEELWRNPARALEKARNAQEVLRKHSWAREQERFCDLVEQLVSE